MKLSSFEAIVQALEKSDVRYLIAGGLAVVAHGHGRVTFDVDLVIQLRPDNTLKAMQTLGTLGYKPLVPVSAADFANPTLRQSWIREKNMVVFQLHSDQHLETRIDIFVTEPFDFDSEYNRALTAEILPGIKARFVGLETLLQMKKTAGREKDKEDIRQLKLLHGDGDSHES
jgi:hypothetical protein